MTEQGKKYLSDVFRAIELIEEFTKSVHEYDNFLSDLKTQSAVERQLGIIGEAVNKFDQLFPESSIEHARKIVGFRNRIIHSYDAVDTSIIWTIIQRHLDPLKKEIIEKLKAR
jgi:uncharacterized protein with HEPN domain